MARLRVAGGWDTDIAAALLDLGGCNVVVYTVVMRSVVWASKQVQPPRLALP